MKDPDRPFTCIILILVGFLSISIPILIPAFKIEIMSLLDPKNSIPDYAHAVYNLFWLLIYLIGTSIGVILIGYGLIHILRLCRKKQYRVELD